MKAETTAAAVAAPSAVAWVFAMIGDFLVQLFGVPLPVFIAALAGAWFALSRSNSESKGFGRSLLEVLLLTAFACFLSHLAAWGLEVAFSVKLPTNALAGVTALLAVGIPIAGPILEEMLPQVLRAQLERLKGNGKQGGRE